MQSLYKVGHFLRLGITILYEVGLLARPMRSRIFPKLGVSNLYVVRYFSILADGGLYQVEHLRKLRVINLNKERHLSKFLIAKL